MFLLSTDFKQLHLQQVRGRYNLLNMQSVPSEDVQPVAQKAKEAARPSIRLIVILGFWA